MAEAALVEVASKLLRALASDCCCFSWTLVLLSSRCSEHPGTQTGTCHWDWRDGTRLVDTSAAPPAAAGSWRPWTLPSWTCFPEETFLEEKPALKVGASEVQDPDSDPWISGQMLAHLELKDTASNDI